MANTSKVVNQQEIVRWFEEGRSLSWMVQEYKRKYHVDVTDSMFGNIADDLGIEYRLVFADELVPWKVEPEHKMQYRAVRLRDESRRRAGKLLDEKRIKRSLSWVASLNERGVVIDYDPAQGGFIEVPRTEEDTDIVRQPTAVDRQRRKRASKRSEAGS